MCEIELFSSKDKIVDYKAYNLYPSFKKATENVALENITQSKQGSSQKFDKMNKAFEQIKNVRCGNWKANLGEYFENDFYYK